MPFDPTPHIERIPHRVDPLRPARGLATGFVFSLVLWAAMAAMLFGGFKIGMEADRAARVVNQERFEATPRSIVMARSAGL